MSNLDALRILHEATDPQAGEPYTPCTPADAIPVEPSTESGCVQTHTGTHYPSFDSVPWQAQGSAVLVECDGTGPAHGRQ